MLGRKYITNFKYANLWPFKTLSTEELQHRDFTDMVVLGHKMQLLECSNSVFPPQPLKPGEKQLLA